MGSFISTPSDPPQNYSDPHTPSEWDVTAVRTALMERLPPELIDEILHKAQYWPVIHGSCDSHFQVQSSNIDESFDTSYCCLITPPIPTARRLATTRLQTLDQACYDDVDMDIRRKVQTVMFRFTSRDQGWGEEFGLEARYAGSWTWFDAEIWRPVLTTSDHQEEVGSSIASTAHIKPMMYSPADESLLAAGYVRVIPPTTADTQSKNAWLIQRNLHASDTIQQHTIVWSDGEFIGYDCQEHTRSDNTDLPLSISSSLLRVIPAKQNMDGHSTSIPDVYGCGNGLEFVSALRPGDRVVVVARAKYPGRCNRIHGNMSVDIAYSVI